MPEVLVSRRESPLRSYWLESLADEVLELIGNGMNYVQAQERIREAARRHGYAPWALTRMIGNTWDRWGVVRANLPMLDRV